MEKLINTVDLPPEVVDALNRVRVSREVFLTYVLNALVTLDLTRHNFQSAGLLQGVAHDKEPLKGEEVVLEFISENIVIILIISVIFLLGLVPLLDVHDPIYDDEREDSS